MPFFLFLPMLALPILSMFGRRKPTRAQPAPGEDPRAVCRDIARIPDERVPVYLQKLEEYRREFGDLRPHFARHACWHEYMQLRSRIIRENPGRDVSEQLRDAELKYRVCLDRARVAEERWREIRALRMAIVRDCIARTSEAIQLPVTAGGA